MLNQTQTELLVTKRDGRAVQFDANLIQVAMQKAFAAEQGLADPSQLSADLSSEIERLTAETVSYTHLRAHGDLSTSRMPSSA